jgi:hypothetical protein
VQRVSLNLGFSRKELDGKVLDDVAHFLERTVPRSPGLLRTVMHCPRNHECIRDECREIM